MNRLVRGSVILAAAAVSWACGGLDTDGIDTTAELVADPGVVYVANTDSQAVFVEALNDLGQQLEGNFALSNVGAGLVVTLDTAFAPRPGVENLPTRVRYFVRAADPTTFVNSSFTVTANGQSLVIPVRITPTNLQITLSNGTPALGEPVTLTAPANVVFTSASAVTLVTGQAVVSALSPDSTQLTILFGPGINATTFNVTNVAVTYLPDQLFTLPVTSAVQTPGPPTSIPAVFTPASANGNQDIVVTAAGFVFQPGVTATVGGRKAVVISAGGTVASVIIRPEPGTSGVVTFNNVALDFLPAVALTGLVSVNTVTVNNTVPAIAGTDDPGTAPVVVTLPTSGPTGFIDQGDFSGADNLGGGGGNQNWRFTLTAARTVRFTMDWANASDIDFYLVNGSFTAFVGSTSASATGAQPETQTVANLAAGTYYIVGVNFLDGPVPAWIKMTLE
jgi:hypothetical protein